MFPRTRSTFLIGATIAGGAVLLTGCWEDVGTNGVGKLPPEKIESRTRAAAESAKSVRLSGVVVSNGKRYRIDMRLKEGGGVGRVSTSGSTFQLLRVGQELFLKADEEFYHDTEGGKPKESDHAAAEKLKDKYVKVPHDDPAYRQFTGFTDMRVLLDGFFVLNGQLATGDYGSVRGTRTIELLADGGRGGAVDVSLEGTPYPLRYRRAGGAGTIELSDYNKDFALKAPDDGQIVDYGKQITAHGR